MTSPDSLISSTAAAKLIEPDAGISRDALNIWHDYVHGPKDNDGKRVFTTALCEQIRAARAKAARRVRA